MSNSFGGDDRTSRVLYNDLGAQVMLYGGVQWYSRNSAE
jgi:hypothetical protein